MTPADRTWWTALALTVVLCVAACASSTDDDSGFTARNRPSSLPSAELDASTPPPARPSTDVDPARRRVVAATAALSAALVDLSGATRAMEASLDLAEPRSAMAGALAKARRALSAQRAAARARACSAASANLASVRSAVDTVRRARERLLARTAATRAGFPRVEAARAAAERRLAQLLQATRAVPQAPLTVSNREVRDALSAGVARQRAVATTIADAEARAHEAVGNVERMLAAGNATAARACR